MLSQVENPFHFATGGPLLALPYFFAKHKQTLNPFLETQRVNAISFTWSFRQPSLGLCWIQTESSNFLPLPFLRPVGFCFVLFPSELHRDFPDIGSC